MMHACTHHRCQHLQAAGASLQAKLPFSTWRPSVFGQYMAHGVRRTQGGEYGGDPCIDAGMDAPRKGGAMLQKGGMMRLPVRKDGVRSFACTQHTAMSINVHSTLQHQSLPTAHCNINICNLLGSRGPNVAQPVSHTVVCPPACLWPPGGAVGCRRGWHVGVKLRPSCGGSSVPRHGAAARH